MTTNRYEKYFFLKNVMEEVFGSEAWYALKESNHIPTWRKYGVNILKAIGVSIEATVDVADSEWRASISRQLSEGIERIRKDKDIDEIIADLAGVVIKVSFLQIGFMPDRRGANSSVTLRRDNWRLNPHRSVVYIQTAEQKERFFLSVQQKEIGFSAQSELRAEHRRSKTDMPYSEWCNKHLG